MLYGTKKMYIQLDLVTRLTNGLFREVLGTGNLCVRARWKKKKSSSKMRTEKFKSSERAAGLSLTRHSGTLGSGDRYLLWCKLCRSQETRVWWISRTQGQCTSHHVPASQLPSGRVHTVIYASLGPDILFWKFVILKSWKEVGLPHI